MSPSCEYEAATQPPAHTGMNAQSPHSFHGCSRSNRSSADSRQLSLRSSMCPVDIASCPVKPGQAYSEPSGPIVCAWDLCTWHGPLCTPSCVGKPSRFVWSRSCESLSSSTLHESHALPAPEPTDVMHVPFNLSLAAIGVSGMMPFADPGSARTIGLKKTFDSLSAKSCSLRKSSSEGNVSTEL